MNKDWIKLRDRFSKEYIDGVVQFVEAAKHHVNREGQTRCPWKNSHNAMFQTLASLVDHGLVDDILREQPTTENDDNELFKLLNDLQGPMKEGAYGEDEKDFRNEMHENTRQWNVRLALALDAYNPFENMSNAYSMWLVVLIPYNFSPLKCMMKSKFFMSFLIPGSKSPEKEIDVHLKSLIEELKELWNDGVRTYDYMSNKFFQLRTCLLWTINDFPTYGDLLRWSTKGYQACPTCKEDRSSFKRGKISFIGHRRYLPSNHSWHKSKQHDGKLEHRPPPIVTNGDEILKQVTSLNFPKLSTLPMLGHYALVLFDSGSSHSFISFVFASHACLEVEPLDHVLSVSTPSGESMDWLAANHASIDCSQREGTWSILTSVVDTREADVSLSLEPVVRDYPNVFPKELP
ncbi:uncharacterized protein E6C27_scaffold35G00950 [Cucumis melo var. makuwa]|uniref:Transposase-associated domain-containing protein n=1 Tax=Cucumis melo var. makuwa TaxID=1194695 RepID=A0A5A7TAI0_CUCMM|nr:uncharacterized protein E6C27_scaffold35G00950 [Cucumis melo var. makuwa]